MYNYATIKDFWHYLEKYGSFKEFADLNALTGGISEYQRLFALDLVMQALPDGGRMLEMGGGYCQIPTALLKRYPDFYQCWLVDPLEGQGGPTFEQCSQYLHEKVKVVREKFGSFSPSIPDSHFDLFFSVAVLEYVPLPEWDTLFQDIARVCKPGGVIFHSMTVPIDYPLAYDRFYKLRTAAEKAGLEPLNLIDFRIAEVTENPDTFYVSPTVYARWLPHMQAGQNTLGTGVFQRTTAINAVFRKPL